MFLTPVADFFFFAQLKENRREFLTYSQEVCFCSVKYREYYYYMQTIKTKKKKNQNCPKRLECVA